MYFFDNFACLHAPKYAARRRAANAKHQAQNVPAFPLHKQGGQQTTGKWQCTGGVQKQVKLCAQAMTIVSEHAVAMRWTDTILGLQVRFSIGRCLELVVYILSFGVEDVALDYIASGVVFQPGRGALKCFHLHMH